MGLRRRVPRQPAHLRGLCLLEGDLITVGWRECGIVDLSTAGMGITVRHERPSDLIGRSIFVEVPSAGDPHGGVRIEGEIKNAHTIQCGWVRAGIEFNNSETADQAILALLSVLNEVNDAGSTMFLVRMGRRT